MAFTTKVITDTSPDFGDNPQTITESGKPASVEVDNLIPNTAHWTKAEIWQDGVLNDTSDVETFTTLPAGTLTLEYIQTTRSGYGYDVTYRYTSTYAPSSAILSTNGTQFQGFIDSAQHAVSFWVTGLTAGTAYLTNVTLYDIYAESVTVMSSIVTTVVNEVRITDTTPAQTSVECELDYVIDEGFTTGWIDYWMGADDPIQTQPQGHFYFDDGDETCTVSGLTAGTAYKFRATIVLGDGTTEIYSSVVTDTTVVDYASQYFTITNESDVYNAKITMQAENNSATTYVYYSRDNGSTWQSILPSERGVELTTLRIGESVIVKHTGAMAQNYNGSYYAIWFSCTTDVSISGNIASLCFGDNFTGVKTMPNYAYYKIFKGWTDLINAENLYFGSTPVVADYGLNNTFYGCRYLTKLPDLSVLTSVGKHGMTRAFSYCDSIVSGADFRNIRSVGDTGMQSIYEHCLRMTTAYAPSVTTWSTSNMNNWLNIVASEGVVWKPANLNIPTGLKSGIPTGWTTQDYN